MYFFEGAPILIDFDSDKHICTIVTKTKPTREQVYDVDWIAYDTTYYCHLSGSRPFSETMLIGTEFSPENKPLLTSYWSDPQLKVQGPEHCHRITAQELFERLLSKEEQAIWLKSREKTTVTEEDVPSFFEYWDEWGNVLEGETVYCFICDRRFHTESRCTHIEWCDTCDEYSVPEGECPHRSTDGLLYVEPE